MDRRLHFPMPMGSREGVTMVTVLNSIFPVFALIALGTALKKLKFTSDEFLHTSDNLIYFIFFPAMLFWKIGAPSSPAAIDWKLSLAVLSAVFSVYITSLLFVKAAHVEHEKAGAFSQCCYRFNTYVGMAVMLTALGDEGVRVFAVTIGVVIPFINLLAVSTLIWYSGSTYGTTEKFRLFIKATVSNPLILACLTGVIYSKLRLPFPAFLENSFRLVSLVALPMALISIGGSLNLAKLQGHLKMVTIATLLKLLLLPVLGYIFLRAYGVAPLPFKVGMIYFALPTATAAYILSAQLHSDAPLASANIIVSTLFSFFSLSLVLAIFVG